MAFAASASPPAPAVPGAVGAPAPVATPSSGSTSTTHVYASPSSTSIILPGYLSIGLYLLSIVALICCFAAIHSYIHTERDSKERQSSLTALVGTAVAYLGLTFYLFITAQ